MRLPLRPSTFARLLLPAFLLGLPFAGCQCVDETSSQKWRFGTNDALPDLSVDTEPPPPDTNDTWDPVDTTEPPRDTDQPPVDTWQPENVVADVQCANALDDRTSMIVDRQGTTWVGFHKYRSSDCDRRPTLVVARKPIGGGWSEEDIQPHRGIFGLSSIRPGHPIVVYPDPVPEGTGQFRAARREGTRNWQFHDFDIGNFAVQRGDGFDVDEDGESFWVTFARDDGRNVQLFEYDTTRSNPGWRGRASLNLEDPRPALGRGLRTNPGEDLYLVHNPRGPNLGEPYGIVKYDKQADGWTERDYFDAISDGATVHSFVVRQNGELCLSSRERGHLVVSCGSIRDIDGDHEYFDQQGIPNVPPSSITEGDDGTLYVAFHPPKNSPENELRLAKKSPGGSWSIQTIYDRTTSAVSTAIDKSGDLVLAFYTRERDGDYALKVLRERPDQL